MSWLKYREQYIKCTILVVASTLFCKLCFWTQSCPMPLCPHGTITGWAYAKNTVVTLSFTCYRQSHFKACSLILPEDRSGSRKHQSIYIQVLQNCAKGIKGITAVINGTSTGDKEKRQTTENI